jgi:hypothetical protein
VAFDETLKPFVKDAGGTRLKDLPKALQSDDATLATAATERYKQIKKEAKAIAGLQLIRLELAMVARRRWSTAEFRQFFLEHPLLRFLTTRLVWGVYAGDVLQDAFRVAEGWTLADGSDSHYVLADTASVGIAHVLEMTPQQQAAFGQVLADYEILQPFKQLGREIYKATDAELAAAPITRFAAKQVATGSIMGLINRGWERGEAQDAGFVHSFHKRLGDFAVELRLDPGFVVGDLSYEPKQKLQQLQLQRRTQRSQQGALTFALLDAILLSEVLRDLDLLAPID